MKNVWIIMSKLKKFMKKHPGIFSIQFGVFVVLLIASIVVLALLRDQSEEPVIQEDPPLTPPVEDGTNVPELPPEPEFDFDFTDMQVTTENISEFITLGQYKGLSVGGSGITQQDLEGFLEEYSDFILVLQEETSNRPVQDGDLVIIDYLGIMDGVPFPGGADNDAGLLIGSGQFIPGFEEQIIGHSIGEEFSINLSFPEEYHSEELAGQDVVFEITLKRILTNSTSEQSRDWVWDSEMREVVAYDEYLSLVREMLESEFDTGGWTHILGTIIDNSTIHMLPNNEIDELISSILIEISTDYADYEMGIEELIMEITGGTMTLDEFVEYELRPYAIDTIVRNLVVRAIAAEEGLIVTDEDFENFIHEHGFESIDSFVEIYSEDFLFLIILSVQVEDFVMRHTVEE